MKTTTLLTLLIILFSSFMAHAQTHVDEMVKNWERAKAYTQEYLEAMPESGYALKPTEEISSFAEQMLHISDANYSFISAATGKAVPAGKGQSKQITDLSKENVIRVVLESYDYAINTIKETTPEQMNKTVKLFGRFELTGGAAISKAFEHQTHHRGQTTVYLRLAGVTPPAAKLF